MNKSPQSTDRWKKGVLLVVLVLGIVVFFSGDLAQWLTLAQLKKNRDLLKSAVEANGIRAVGLYILLYILQTALSIPGGAIFTLAGGFLFGPGLGTLYVNIGATLGATLAFLSARYLMRDFVERRIGQRLKTIFDEVEKNPFRILLILRLTALVPFFVINFAFGLTSIRIVPYMLATSLGILPVSFIFTNAGQHLGSLNSIQEILSPKALGGLILLGLAVLVPILYKKFMGSFGSFLSRLRKIKKVFKRY